jgi:two-component system, OmpR family, response regulator CpxR
MRIKILLVDDEKDFVDVLAERLENRGFQVRTAGNGDEALTALKEEQADVVILDVLMPGMDGMEALEEIKKLSPLVEVMMLTGHATIDTAIDGLRLGAYDYLMKPTDTDDLVAKILRAYARKSEQEERIKRAEIDKLIGQRGW